jgi:hypothetical protein
MIRLQEKIETAKAKDGWLRFASQSHWMFPPFADNARKQYLTAQFWEMDLNPKTR